MNSTKAIYGRLEQDRSAALAIDTYQGLPAIFDDQAPDEYLVQQSAPCIVIAAPTEDVDASTYSETFRAIVQDVRFYGAQTGNNQPLDDLARYVRDLFHNRPREIAVEDGKCVIATATGPVDSPTTDPSLVGRRITLRLQLQKEA